MDVLPLGVSDRMPENLLRTGTFLKTSPIPFGRPDQIFTCPRRNAKPSAYTRNGNLHPGDAINKDPPSRLHFRVFSSACNPIPWYPGGVRNPVEDYEETIRRFFRGFPGMRHRRYPRPRNSVHFGVGLFGPGETDTKDPEI